MTMEGTKYYEIRQLVPQIKGELDYIELYAKKQREKLEELDLILSEQEQPDFPITDEEVENFLAAHPKVEAPDKYKTPDWLWKEYEQPEVDLEREVEKERKKLPPVFTNDELARFARYFFELGQRKAAEMYDEIEYNRQRAEEGTLGKTLDEAAEEYAYNNWEDNDYHTGASEGLPFDAIGHTANCFKAGAKWMAGQGVTLKVTDDTTWGEVNDFIHRNCDGAKVIQIRKK